MNTEMADGAAQRCVAQIGEALFGQPGMTLVEIASRRAEIEALRVDAERWRHARKLLTIEDVELRQAMLVEADFLVSERECKKADKAIDTAMGAHA